MDVRDGFIVGIFNYCDSWCETCRFTSHCRVFAEHARAEATTDPQMAAIVHAPPRPEDVPPPPPDWILEIYEGAQEEVARMSPAEVEALVAEPEMPPRHAVTCERAMNYAVAVRNLLDNIGAPSRSAPSDPAAVVSWFCTMIAMKVHRALSGLAEFDGDREFPPDHEGSAKVALIGIDRSIAAWQDLAAVGRIPEASVRRFVDELEILRRDLETAIPLARAFIRPGFDEPEAAARLFE